MANPHTTSNPKSTQVSDSQEIPARKIHIRKMSAATPEEMAAAVERMNDWSGGQFYILEWEYFPGINYAMRLFRDAEIAFEYRYDELTDYATQVCVRLFTELPPLIRRAEAEARTPKQTGRTSMRISPDRPTMPGFVYLIQSPTTAYKIGRTKNPRNRMKTFGIQLPFEVEYVCLIETNDMIGLEKELHERYANKRVNGEWFELSPHDVAEIKSLGGE